MGFFSKSSGREFSIKEAQRLQRIKPLPCLPHWSRYYAEVVFGSSRLVQVFSFILREISTARPPIDRHLTPTQAYCRARCSRSVLFRGRFDHGVCSFFSVSALTNAGPCLPWPAFNPPMSEIENRHICVPAGRSRRVIAVWPERNAFSLPSTTAWRGCVDLAERSLRPQSRRLHPSGSKTRSVIILPRSCL